MDLKLAVLHMDKLCFRIRCFLERKICELKLRHYYYNLSKFTAALSRCEYLPVRTKMAKSFFICVCLRWDFCLHPNKLVLAITDQMFYGFKS